ncbi:hypothetical protein ADUPG1_011609, partial [Aduncisulcus paluster]
MQVFSEIKRHLTRNPTHKVAFQHFFSRDDESKLTGSFGDFVKSNITKLVTPQAREGTLSRLHTFDTVSQDEASTLTARLAASHPDRSITSSTSSRRRSVRTSSLCQPIHDSTLTIPSSRPLPPCELLMPSVMMVNPLFGRDIPYPPSDDPNSERQADLSTQPLSLPYDHHVRSEDDGTSGHQSLISQIPTSNDASSQSQLVSAQLPSPHLSPNPLHLPHSSTNPLPLPPPPP